MDSDYSAPVQTDGAAVAAPSGGMQALSAAGNVATGYMMANYMAAETAAATAGLTMSGSAIAGASLAAPTATTGAALLSGTGGVAVTSGGTLATLGGTSTLAASGVTSAGAASASAAASGAAAGASAGSAFAAAIPWVAAAAVLYMALSSKKKTLKFRRYNDLPRFDLQADKRLAQDKYTPMFMSGTSSRQPWQPGSPISNTSGYEFNVGSQMLAQKINNFSGLGGGRAGYVKPVQLSPDNWTGYQSVTNYGSRSAGFVEKAAGMEQKTMRVKKKAVGSTTASMAQEGWSRF